MIMFWFIALVLLVAGAPGWMVGLAFLAGVVFLLANLADRFGGLRENDNDEG